MNAHTNYLRKNILILLKYADDRVKYHFSVRGLSDFDDFSYRLLASTGLVRLQLVAASFNMVKKYFRMRSSFNDKLLSIQLN